MRSIYPLFIAPFILVAVITMLLTLLLPVYTNDKSQSFTHPTSGAVLASTKKTVTMWQLKVEYTDGSTTTEAKISLMDYFDCSTGNLFTQAMKGFAFVCFFVNLCNFIVCVAHAFLPNAHILKCPLLIFLIVSAACCAPIVTAMIIEYFGKLCDRSSFKDLDYSMGAGLFTTLAAMLCTLIAIIMSIFA